MSSWAPVSPCTTDCVSHAAPPVPLPVAAHRLSSVTRGVARAFLLGERLADPAERRAVAGSVLDALGVRLDVVGDGLAVPGSPGTLVVANHISWLDVLVLQAVEPVTMLAKREISRWPLISVLARRAGTRFIDRENLYALPRTVGALTELLKNGAPVMAFPEGTTWCSTPGGPFRRAVFQAALDAQAPIRPVTLTYLQHDAPTTVAAYVGADTFAASFRRVLTADALTVRLTLHPPIHPVPGVDDRRALTEKARSALAAGASPGHRVVR
ncbi:lysophospholipid acyltransferase family protein [Actinocorallia sp. B10E7]|uniref:lysophospholipid acyltransferase family protein n=1 Tax=Actinocorallia sp. B10E7 TaxID=3153558 RepID=UPI00325F0C5C